MALTRITKGVIKPNENYDTHNINSTGIVTALGLDVNGNGDISGNLNVGGVLTYEDVTSIDSVGIITAQSDIHVGGGVSAVGVGTFGGLDINGNVDISGDLDVDGHTNLDHVSIAGVTTFAGAIDANGDLDVDGHTNLDNVSIAGVTTFASTIVGTNATFSGNINNSPAGNGSISGFGAITIQAPTPALNFTETDADPDYRIVVLGGQFRIQDVTNSNANRFIINTDGTTSIEKNLNCLSDLDVDGHTNLDNVSVAGVSTFSGTIETTGSELKITGAEPRLTFTDTDNNPDFQIWANAERFSIYDNTNNATRLRITGAGLVGIGTDTPTYPLQVHSSSAGGLLRLLSSHEGNYDLRFVYQNSETNIWSYASSDMTIGTRFAKKLHLVTNGPGKRLTIDDGGRVGIGTQLPDTQVEIGYPIGTGTANLLKLTSYTNSQSSRPALVFWNNNPNTAQAQISAKGGASYNASKLHFSVANSSRALQDRACIDEYGTFIIGPGESRRNTKGSNQHQVLLIEGTGNNSTRMSMIRSSNDDNGPEIQLIKTRGTSIGSVTKPNQNDYIGSLVFIGGDDSDLYARGADISVQATGTPANDRIPSDIIFSTTPTSGATSPQEAVRITSEGRVGIDKPTNVAAKLNIGDTNNDGALSQLIKLGNDSSGAGTGSQINLGLVHGNESTSACIAGFLDSGGGTSFIVKTAGTYANQSTVAERLRIYNSGRILIGDGSVEHSPSGNLDIVGDTNSNGPELYLRISNNNTTDNIGALIFGNNVDKTVCMIRSSTHTANNTGDIEFHTSTSGTMKEKVRIFNDGKVRIQGEEASGNQMYLDIIGNSQTETAGLRSAGCRFIGPESRRMYFELQGNDVSDHFRFITSPNNDRALDSVALHIGNNNRIGMSQADPDAATLHIGNSYATTSSNVALQVGTITGQNRYLAINHFNNQQNFYQLKMRCNDNQMVPMLDMGNPYGSANHGTAINFHGYQDSKVGAIESENTATNSSSSVDMVLRTGAGPKEVLRLQSNGDARFYNGLFIAKVDNDNSGFSRSGFYLGNPAISEYVYTWSGHSSYTIDLTCASYFSCIWEYFQHQTNGGSRMQQYARGKWSNNHYQHTLNVWEWSGSGGGLSVSFTASDQSGGGSINGLSNMSNNGSTYSGFINGGGEGSSNTANGRFRISETYNWGSVSSRALIVRVSYGSFNISKS